MIGVCHHNCHSEISLVSLNAMLMSSMRQQRNSPFIGDLISLHELDQSELSILYG